MDFAIFSTRVFTGNPAQPWAEALKITDHRITHVGSNAEVKVACGHSIWVNTVALDRASVTGRTPNPAGGHIDKDPASGEPTGFLREARDIIEAHIALPTLEERKQMVLAAQADALRYGITGVHTCEMLDEWEAFAALEAEGKLKVRVYHLQPPDLWPDVETEMTVVHGEVVYTRA